MKERKKERKKIRKERKVGDNHDVVNG